LDLNHLYHRHQISLFMAENAASVTARQAHCVLAAAYADRIAAAKNPPQPSLRAPSRLD